MHDLAQNAKNEHQKVQSPSLRRVDVPQKNKHDQEGAHLNRLLGPEVLLADVPHEVADVVLELGLLLPIPIKVKKYSESLYWNSGFLRWKYDAMYGTTPEKENKESVGGKKGNMKNSVEVVFCPYVFTFVCY